MKIKAIILLIIIGLTGCLTQTIEGEEVETEATIITSGIGIGEILLLEKPKEPIYLAPEGIKEKEIVGYINIEEEIKGQYNCNLTKEIPKTVETIYYIVNENAINRIDKKGVQKTCMDRNYELNHTKRKSYMELIWTVYTYKRK